MRTRPVCESSARLLHWARHQPVSERSILQGGLINETQRLLRGVLGLEGIHPSQTLFQIPRITNWDAAWRRAAGGSLVHSAHLYIWK